MVGSVVFGLPVLIFLNDLFKHYFSSCQLQKGNYDPPPPPPQERAGKWNWVEWGFTFLMNNVHLESIAASSLSGHEEAQS